MEILGKLKILSAAAKYDVSCSSSGSSRKNKGGTGNAHIGGICHSWSEDGRCISLLKILMTNFCVYDCVYCINRVSNDVERALFTPEEIAELTINFYKRNYIEGLFLSSAVYKNPNYTMELMIKALKILRYTYKFNGYIHVKVIPRADEILIREIGTLADRVSVNIELPTSKSLKLLAPQKKKEDIVKPMSFIKSSIIQTKEEKKLYVNSSSFVPAGQTTQLIVGATKDTDLNILNLSENLYKKMDLKRVYYSGYVPVVKDHRLPTLTNSSFLREHRLYQADWLLRFYGFSANEILDEKFPQLNSELDPKTDWALRNMHLFPVEINKADFGTLIRVPGIGVKSARRIIIGRKNAFISFDTLKSFGVVLKRAKFFITCIGKYNGGVKFERSIIEDKLILKKEEKSFTQLSFFSNTEDKNIILSENLSKITGEF